jgi:antitoxin component of MazEF toxin-antitoxin module
MLLRRIFKQGNSAVVTIPMYLLAELGLEIGDYFIIEGLGSRGVFMTPRTAKEVEARRIGELQ